MNENELNNNQGEEKKSDKKRILLIVFFLIIFICSCVYIGFYLFNNYQAGNGIAITNDTIEARLGNGLEFNESKAIQVKLGVGLKFDEKQGVQAITIDNNVGEVVEEVNKLQEDFGKLKTLNSRLPEPNKDILIPSYHLVQQL